MNPSHLKCSLILLFLSLTLPGFAEKTEVEKRINKVFSIRPEGNLVVENRYGKIDVAIGAANTITMDVVIKARSGSLKKAQETLDRISVDFEEGNNHVEAVTHIESSSSWMSWFDSGNAEMEINYNILVPAEIFMDLRQKYGSIFVESTNRKLTVDLSYGDLRLGDINAALSLEMAYSNGAISRIQSGEMIMSYSDLDMEDAQSIDVDMKYTDLSMGSATRANIITAYADFRAMDIDEMTYSGKYDDVVIDRVKTIDMESAYSGWKIGGLSHHGHFDMRYGDLQISNIAPGFTKLDINTAYTGVVLRFQPGASFSVDAQNNYCGIHHQGLKVTEEIQRTGSVTFKGFRGSGGGSVITRMNYGDLSIE
jgi:hypothetical protein